MNSKARTFFFVSAGILCLALSYHLGARNVGAQSAANPIVAVIDRACGNGVEAVALTANGDVYMSPTGGDCYKTWSYYGSVFGGPVSAQSSTWGQVKSRYLSRTPDRAGTGVKPSTRDGR